MPNLAEDEAQDGRDSGNAAVSPGGEESWVRDGDEVGSLQLVFRKALMCHLLVR